MNLLLPLLRGVGITCIVSAAVGLFLVPFSIPFINTFIFTLVCQFIIFYFYGEYVRRKNNKIRLEAELKLEEEKSRQYANVVCPCDRQILSTIPLSLNMENRYSCPGCKKDISVFVETKTALTTVPLLNNPLDAPLIAEEVNKLLKSDAN